MGGDKPVGGPVTVIVTGGLVVVGGLVSGSGIESGYSGIGKESRTKMSVSGKKLSGHRISGISQGKPNTGLLFWIILPN